MKRIHLLPDTVKNKIAAGEVIEGPFSIIKELIENSLDAGATEIEVQVFDSGMKKILVRDNGSGIFPEDVTLAITEHATSKINDINDIEHISSYGFRGEALSSIASVSELTILTRPPEIENGVRLTSSRGNHEQSGYAGPSGTTVIVENLFFNIPARKKFLKSKAAESRYIREIFLKTAIANPGVTFFLDVDGKRKISLIASGNQDLRIQQVYGKETFDRLHYQKIQDIKVTIEGYMSAANGLMSNRNMQLLYINGRPVEYRYYGFILNRAYEGIAIKGTYPAALIFITIDPSLVDVNIHPSKREVKLFDQKYIDSLIYALAEKTLNRSHAIRSDQLKTEKISKPISDFVAEEKSLPLTERYGNVAQEHRQSRPDFTAPIHERPVETVRDISELYKTIQNNQYAIPGIAFGTYIIFQDGDLLTFIDFHAAHERMIFDRLVESHEDIISQELLFPKIIELSLEDYHIVMENLEIFSEIGFDIEGFSDNSLIIRGVPVMARDIEYEKVINDFIESIRHENDKTMTMRGKVAASVACHSARRAGDNLSFEEQIVVVDYIKKGARELRCPHGRPFVYTLSKNELERLFKRS